MAALIGIATQLRAVAAAHVALELVDWRCLGPANDIERHGLVSIATEAADFEIAIACVQRVADSRRWLCWPLVAKHALVPGIACDSISIFARLRRQFGTGADGASIDSISRFGAHRINNGPEGRFVAIR